jgi:hypothetical protein
MFIEGTTLFEQGKFAEACSKFEESERLDQALGTEFNVADCYERQGKTASAWAMFQKVEQGAAAKGKQDRAQAAHDRRVALEPKLARLTIVTRSIAGTAGVGIVRDGKPVPPGELDQPTPIDPGTHTIEVSAAGRVPFRNTLKAEEGRTVELVVPSLVEVPVVAPPPPPPPEVPKPRWTGMHTAGVVVGTIGIAGLAVGGAMGGLSLAKHNAVQSEAPPGCTPLSCASQQVINDASAARTFGNVSTAGFAAGGTLLAVGIVLFAVAPSLKAPKATALRVQVGPKSLAFEGTW